MHVPSALGRPFREELEQLYQTLRATGAMAGGGSFGRRPLLRDTREVRVLRGRYRVTGEISAHIWVAEDDLSTSGDPVAIKLCRSAAAMEHEARVLQVRTHAHAHGMAPSDLA